MALQMDYIDSRLEVTKTNCYWKIGIDDGIQGGKNKIRCRIVCYKDQAQADINRKEYSSKSFEFVPDMVTGDNFIIQAYNHIKSLSEFSSAVDV